MPTYSKKRERYNLLKDQRYYRSSGIYDYRNSLKLWLRASKKEDDLFHIANIIQQGTLISSARDSITVDTPISDKFPLKGWSYPTTTIDMSTNLCKGFLEHDLTPGNGLLISFWVNIKSGSHPAASNAGNSYMTCMAYDPTSGFKEPYWEIFGNGGGDSAGQIGFRYLGRTTSFFNFTLANKLSLGWQHIIFHLPVQASVLDSTNHTFTSAQFSAANPKIFVNGIPQQTEAISEYSPASYRTRTGNPNENSAIIFANGYGEANISSGAREPAFFHGEFSELAIFAGSQIVNLSDEQIAFLYKASIRGAHGIKSGYLNIPARAKYREMDDRGFFPTLHRGIDHTRKGDHKIFWDDSRMHVDSTKGTVNYPSKLNSEDPLLSNFLYDFYLDGNLDVPIEDPIGKNPTHPQYQAPFDVVKEFTNPDGSITVNTYKMSGSHQTGSIHLPEEYSIYDEFYDRVDRPTLPPFNDNRVLENDSIFYVSGTSYISTALPFASQSLDDKQQIYLELNNSKATLLGFNDRTSNYTNQNMSFMAYYSFTGNQFNNKTNYSWPGQNTAAAKSYLDTLHSIGPGSNGTTVMISPDGTAQQAFGDEFYNSPGGIVSSFGFPSDKKYNSTSGQSISASDLIHEPFLLEKLIVEFEGVNLYGHDNFIKSWDQSHSSPSYQLSTDIMTWDISAILMKEYPESLGFTSEIPLYDMDGSVSAAAANLKVSTTTTTSTTDPAKNRDILAIGKAIVWTTISSPPTTAQTNQRNVWENTILPKITKANYSNSFKAQPDNTSFPIVCSNQSFSIRFEPCKYDKLKNVGMDYVGTSGGRKQTSLSWDFGAVSGRDDPANATWGTPIATDLGKKTISYPNPIFSQAPQNLSFSKSPQRENMPMVILPTDKLIFALHLSPSSGMPYSMSSSGVELPLGSKVRFRMFGSYMKAAQPKPNNLNQTPQFTKNINTTFKDLWHDQWDIQYRTAFSGSFHDKLMSGSHQPDFFSDNQTGTLYNSEGINFNRKTVGKASSDGSGKYGALKRNLKLSDNKYFHEDSIYYDLFKVWPADGASINDLAAVDYYTIGDWESGDYKHNKIWPFTWPYSKRYRDLEAPKTLGSVDSRPGVDYVLYRTVPSNPGGTEGFYLDGYYDQVRYDASPPANTSPALGVNDLKYAAPFTREHSDTQLNEIDSYTAYINTTKILFGFGTGIRKVHRSLLLPRHPWEVKVTYYWWTFGYDATNTHFYIDHIRGAKYGFSSVQPLRLSAVYRRNHFGFWCDRLEQRKDTKLVYIDENDELVEVDSPVQASFWSNVEIDTQITGDDSMRFNTSGENQSDIPYIEEENHQNTLITNNPEEEDDGHGTINIAEDTSITISTGPGNNNGPGGSGWGMGQLKD